MGKRQPYCHMPHVGHHRVANSGSEHFGVVVKNDQGLRSTLEGHFQSYHLPRIINDDVNESFMVHSHLCYWCI